MEFIKEVPEWKFLVNVLENKEAVLFCGAGISQEPPAGLPEWQVLRNSTLEAIAGQDAFLQPYLPGLIEEPMQCYGRYMLSPELLAAEIRRQKCENYFESFRSLYDGEPNASHQYLVKLVKAGLVKYILTTNFDLFLERALDKEGIRYKVYRTKEELAAFGQNAEDVSLHLVKLNGCISIPTSISDTRELEAQTLYASKAKILEQLLPQYYFVFLGYSGADLLVNLDYWYMQTLKDKAKGFVWNFLQRGDVKESVPSEVDTLVKQYGDKAHIVYGKLPEMFDSMLVEADRIPYKTYSSEEEKSWISQKNTQLQTMLKSWASQNVTPLQASTMFGEWHGLEPLEKTSKCFQHCAQLYRDKQDHKGLAQMLNTIGGLYHIHRQPEQALSYWKQIEPLIGTIEDKQFAMFLNNTVLNRIAGAYYVMGKHKEALSYLQQAEQSARAAGDKKWLADTLSNVGGFYFATEEYDKSLTYLKETEALDRELGNEADLLAILENLGTLHRICGRYDAAVASLSEAETLAKKLNDRTRLALVSGMLGVLYKGKRNYPEALVHFIQAEEILRTSGDRNEWARCLNSIGEVYAVQLNVGQALAYFQKAEKLTRDLRDQAELATSLNNLGGLYYTQKDYPKALQYFTEAEKITRTPRLKNRHVHALSNLGMVYYNQKKYREAQPYFQQAKTLCQELGDANDLNSLEQILHEIHMHLHPKTIVSPKGKIGRNEPCSCGSGKKYKNCCGGKTGKK